MNSIIDAFVGMLGRFFTWMLGTRNGWIFMVAVILTAMITYQPHMLENLVSNMCAWLINLLARIFEANKPAFEKLFCIALLCFGIVKMLKSVFKKSSSSTKK